MRVAIPNFANAHELPITSANFSSQVYKIGQLKLIEML